MLRALIFDMDGVLIDNSRYYTQAWAEFVAAHPDERLQAYPSDGIFGRRNLDLLRELLPELGATRWDELSQELERRYWRLFQPHLRPIAGLPELLAEAGRRRLHLALATSAPYASMANVLGGLGWLTPSPFELILTERDVVRGKPAPDIYRLAGERLGCAPGESVVFEDSLAGVEAGRAAGMTVLGLATSYPTPLLLEAGAEWVMTDYRDPRLRPRLGWD